VDLVEEEKEGGSKFGVGVRCFGKTLREGPGAEMQGTSVGYLEEWGRN
jgi:hypothetical protein